MQHALSDLLKDARRQGLPLWSFTAYNFEMAAAVLSAAEASRIPVVLLVSEQAARSELGPRLIEMLVALTEASSAQCCVELDHARDIGVIRAALEGGVRAVMADGAMLDYVDNVGFVNAVSRIARTAGAEVEAELGLISGAEDSLRASVRGALTDVEESRRFVTDTNVDCLAISIGNAHGHYNGIPSLDWERLRGIRMASDAPLALHGVSGLDDEVVVRAVSAGVTKFNVNTELREVYFREGIDLLKGNVGALDVLGVSLGLIERLSSTVESKLRMLRGREEPRERGLLERP